MKTIKEYDKNKEIKEIYKFDKYENKWIPMSYEDMIIGILIFILKAIIVLGIISISLYALMLIMLAIAL